MVHLMSQQPYYEYYISQSLRKLQKYNHICFPTTVKRGSRIALFNKIADNKKILKCQYGLRPCWVLLGLWINRHFFLFLMLFCVYSNPSIFTLLLWILKAADYHINPLASALKKIQILKKRSVPESKNWSVDEFQQLHPVQTAFSQQVNNTALDKCLCKKYNQIATKV